MSVLEPGLGLKPGQSIQSNNKQFVLTLQTPPNDGHRRNILSPSVREIGIGYAFNQNTTYKHHWTQDFGAR